MKKYLTITELGDMLSLGPRAIYDLRQKGLPSKKIGRSLRFDQDEVIEWIEEQNNKEELDD